MTAGEAVTGASEVSKAEIDMSSHQDLTNVGADYKLKVVNVSGDGNVPDDPDGSYVLVSDAAELTTDDPIPVLDTEVNNVQAEHNNGENPQSSIEDDNHCVLLSADKGIALLGEPKGEVVDLEATGSTVGYPSGTDFEEHKNGKLDCEVKVQDQVELEATTRAEETLDYQIRGKVDANGELGESHSLVIVSLGANRVKSVEENNLDTNAELGELQESIIESQVVDYSSIENVKPLEQNNQDSTLELKERREPNAISLSDGYSSDKSLNLVYHNNLNSNAYLGGIGESVTKLPEAGELSDESVKPKVENNLDPAAELGENKKSEYVVLKDSGCELPAIEVDVLDVMSKEQVELEAVRESEVSSESQIRITRSADSATHQLDNKEDKLQTTTDLDIDVAVKLTKEADAITTKEIVYCKPAVDECIDRSQGARELNESLRNAPSLPSPTSSVESDNNIGEVPVECGGPITGGPNDGIVVEQELAIADNSHDVLVEQENLGNETGAPQDTETSWNFDSDENKVSENKEPSECIDGSRKDAELSGDPINADIFPSPNGCVLQSTDLKAEEFLVKGAGNFLGSPDAGTVSDQGLAVADIVGSGPVQGLEAEKIAQDTETARGPISDQNKDSQINYDDECISGSPKSTEVNVNPGNAESAPADCMITDVKTRELAAESDGGFQFGSHDGTVVEREVDNVVISENIKSEFFFAADGTKSETESDNSLNGMSTGAASYVSSEAGIEFGSIDPALLRSIPRSDNVLMKSQVSNGDTKSAHDQSVNNHFDPQTPVVDGGCGDTREEPICQEPEESICNHLGPQAHVLDGRCGDNQEEQICQKTEDTPGILGDGISGSLTEGSIGDVADENNLVVEVVTKPFHFLIRCPRFDDENFREQLRDAQLIVDEKTQQRDDLRPEIHAIKEKFHALGDAFNAADLELRAARKLVRLKRQEIDSVQAVNNRVKNAKSVEDMARRISYFEHRIEHETVPLKEEKQLIRDIKQLKLLREELSSNMGGTQDEVEEALSQKDDIEGRLKDLKKELNGLKDGLSKAEAAALLAKKKYYDERKKLIELQAQFNAANDIRQKAYEYKRKLHEKIKYFWVYKEDAKAASEYALCGDREALHHLCVNQVETMMELWNNNDEFRNDYVRCNMRSTLRRLKTLDGRSLGPGKEPPVLPQPNYVDERVDRPSNETATSLVSPPSEQENQVPPVKVEIAEGKSMEVEEEPKKQILISKTTTKQGSVSGEVEAAKTKVEENLQTKESLELAMTAEALRKEEIAEKLKEQKRLEEKAKAQEALERKKRNAEKAQIRAELRAQKEAEQKEKEREKRLRKKERKQSGVDGNNIDGEISPASELLTTEIFTTKELESKVGSFSTTLVTKPHHKPSHFTKQSKPKAAIPPPLRNKGKKRLKQFMWWTLGALLVVVLFLGGTGGAFYSLKSRKDNILQSMGPKI